LPYQIIDYIPTLNTYGGYVNNDTWRNNPPGTAIFRGARLSSTQTLGNIATAEVTVFVETTSEEISFTKRILGTGLYAEIFYINGLGTITIQPNTSFASLLG
jgi:hypothetical protein